MRLGSAGWVKGRRRLLGWLCLLLLMSGACEKKKAKVKAFPGVDAARAYLYPYKFTDAQTLRGTQLLERFLEQHPVHNDRPIAAWLLVKSYLDLYTHALALEAMGDPGGAVLFARLAEVFEPEGDGAVSHPSLIASIRARLVLIPKDSVVAEEAQRAAEFLETLEVRDSTRAAVTLKRLAATGSQVSINARLVIAARALTLLEALPTLKTARLPDRIATDYPYPCPEGYAAYLRGDHSFPGCSIICDAARSVIASQPDQLLNDVVASYCSPSFFGLSHRRELVYLSPENIIVARSLRHMLSAHRRLLKTHSQTSLGSLQGPFVKHYRERLDALTVPLLAPFIGPEAQGGLELPQLQTLRLATAPPLRVLTLRADAAYLGAAAHLRVDRDTLIVPESSLGYQAPGRLIAPFERPFVFGEAQVIDGLVGSFAERLSAFERDRPQLVGLALVQRSDRIVMGDEPLRHGSSAELRLNVDARAPLRTLTPLLRTAAQEGLRSFELLSWDPVKKRGGVTPFGVWVSPRPTGAALVEISPRGWRLEGATSASAVGSPLDTLGELAGLLRGVEDEIYVSFDPDLDVRILAITLEVLERPRVGAAASAAEWLALAPAASKRRLVLWVGAE